MATFVASNATIDDLGEVHGNGVLRVIGKGTKVALVTVPPTAGRAIDRAVGDRVRGPVLLNRNGVRMDRHAAAHALPPRHSGGAANAPNAPLYAQTCICDTMFDARVSLRDVQIAARHADPKTTMRYDRARKNLDRHPNCILAAYMASGT